MNLDEHRREAYAFVPEEQLSLAIGKAGQNVRLAAKLTGWKIDVRAHNSEKEPKEKEPAPKDTNEDKNSTPANES